MKRYGTCSECLRLFVPFSDLHLVGDWYECNECWGKRQGLKTQDANKHNGVKDAERKTTLGNTV
jgi:hypothetical protein